MNGTIRLERGYWVTDIMIAGRRRRRTFPFNRKQDAINWLADMRMEKARALNQELRDTHD